MHINLFINNLIKVYFTHTCRQNYIFLFREGIKVNLTDTDKIKKRLIYFFLLRGIKAY